MVATSKLTKLQEQVQFSEKPSKVDRENRVIHGVKVLGSVSRYRSGKVRRKYSEQAMRDAAKIYEGIGVKVDHPDRNNPNAERSVTTTIGWLEGCEIKEDGVYANLHYLESHSYTPQLLELAERNPSKLGLSHNADGLERKEGGVAIVESVESVISVDIVDKPATNSGLYESQEEEPEVKKTFKQFIESMQASSEKKALVSLLEEDPAMSEMPAPEAAADASGDDQISMAFEAAVVAAFRDKKLDMKGKMAKIKTILKSYESISGEGGEKKKEAPAPSSEGEGGDPAKKMESMEAELTTLKEKDKVRSFMESQEIRPTEDRIAALLPLDEARRKSLCADFKAADAKAATPAKPRSSSILESQEREIPGKFPDDPKEFAKAVTVQKRY